MDMSNKIFVMPKSVLHVKVTAQTKDSPGSMATSDRTSIIDAKSKNDTSCQQIEYGRKIVLRLDKGKKRHCHIDKISKYYGNRYL